MESKQSSHTKHPAVCERMPMKVPDCTPDGRFGIDNSENGRLGEGAFGVCCLGFHTITQKPVAIKISRRMDVAALEAIVQKRLKHPNVVQLYSAQVSMKEPGVSYLVMECCTGGELFNVIAEQGALHPDAAFRFFCEILSGLAYCHKSGVYHRDLKPENILLSENGHARIADFGLAKLEEKQGELMFAHSHCGSIYYMAPEVVNLQQEGYDPAAADIWSLGVIYYTMLTGCAPWRKASRSCFEFLEFCNHGLWMPSFVPEGTAEILCRMLDVNPTTRATASEVERMVRCLVAAHPLRSLVPSISYNKTSCDSHSYETGIDIPGEVTIADVEHLCFHRTQALLSDHYNGIFSLSTNSDSANCTTQLPSVTPRDAGQTKPPRPWQTPGNTLPNSTTRALLSAYQRSTAPAPHLTFLLLGEKDGRHYESPQSLLPQASPRDLPRRWSSALYEASMTLPWQAYEDRRTSQSFEDSRTSQTTSTSGSFDWCQGDSSSRQGNDTPELEQAALHRIRKQRQVPPPTEMSGGTDKAKRWSLRKSGEEEGIKDLSRFAGPGEEVGYSSGGTGSAWSDASRSAASSSVSCSSCCQIEDMGHSSADLHAVVDVQIQISSTVARGKNALSNMLPRIVGRERLPLPPLIVKADDLPELQSPTESPAASRTQVENQRCQVAELPELQSLAESPAAVRKWLENQRGQVADFLSRRSGARGLRDVIKHLVPQAPPYPKPCGLQRPVAGVAGISLPPKSPYTDRKLQEKAKGGREACLNSQQRSCAQGLDSGLDGGECMHGESGLGTCAKCQEGREDTAGPGRGRRSRLPTPGGYGASEVTHLVLSADSMCSGPSPERIDWGKGGEDDSRDGNAGSGMGLHVFTMCSRGKSALKTPVWQMSPRSCLDDIESPNSSRQEEGDSQTDLSDQIDLRRVEMRAEAEERSGGETAGGAWGVSSSRNRHSLDLPDSGETSGEISSSSDEDTTRVGEEDAGKSEAETSCSRVEDISRIKGEAAELCMQPATTSSGERARLLTCSKEGGKERKNMDELLNRVHWAFEEYKCLSAWRRNTVSHNPADRRGLSV